MSDQNQKLLAEGVWPCEVISGIVGEGDIQGVALVQIKVKFIDGPSKGRVGTYEDEINTKSAKFVRRSLLAAGWTGRAAKTFAADCDAWIKRTGGKTTAEVKYIPIKKGKKYDAWVAAGAPEGEQPIWDKVNAIGSDARTLTAPKAETLTDADAALGSVGDDDVPSVTYSNGASTELRDPRTSLAATERPSGNTADQDDIPFASCDVTAEPTAIAKVLR